MSIVSTEFLKINKILYYYNNLISFRICKRYVNSNNDSKINKIILTTIKLN